MPSVISTMRAGPSSGSEADRIVFYDGYCVLCSRSVDFILSRDTRAGFRFASLQSVFAHKALREMGYPVAKIEELSSIVYLRHKDIKIKSDAVLSILWDLGGIYKVSCLGYILPRVIRDFLYNCLAKLRYRVFGKLNSCRIPTQDEAFRFLE